MKAFRIALCLLLLAFSTAAEKSFDQMISLAGTWGATVMTFSLIKPDHPIVGWILLAPGLHRLRAHFDLHRAY
jgi:hypothetical protein